jgi:alpha-D-ribose 1-methylphosphonate 5-triphosphate diphosphatase PhnM
MATDNRINLDREDAAKTIRRLVPTRARLAFSLYDHTGEQRTYRTLSGYRALVSIYSSKELRDLWTAIRNVIEAGGWKDDDARSHRNHAHADVADQPMGGTE